MPETRKKLNQPTTLFSFNRRMPTLHQTLLTSVYNEARAALATAKEELKEAEIRVMKADTKLINARTHLLTVVNAMNAINQNERGKVAVVKN